MESKKLIIIPCPKKFKFNKGNYIFKREGYISITYEDKQALFPVVKRLQQIIKDAVKIKLPIITGSFEQVKLSVVLEKVCTLPQDGYFIDIGLDIIRVGYGEAAGASNAVSTLKQIIVQCGNALPCLTIKDHPDFKVRGIMLDISRNKIPTMTTLYRIADLMADLKLNQLQLYIEGFSFAYPSFLSTWENGTPITGEELVMLDKYCRDRFIDLVPNQNSFGHMTPWLLREEFRHLAECPDGCEAPWGKYDKPLGLNPLDKESITLIERMYDDLLPNFTSGYFNVGCDETFDLGQGKSREQCELLGKGRVYLNFLMKIYEILKRYGKKMMFWGDIIVHYPELIHELPRDIVVLEWGYDADQPSEENCKRFEESEIEYYVCPGTNTWNSITGRTDCMKSNLLNAAVRGKKHGATGFLNTDWGDCGHWQPLPASYAAYVYGAALSWDVEQNKDVDIAAYLDRFVFMDCNHKMGRFVLELGNYYLKEKKTVFNGSGVFRILYYSQLDDKNTDLAFLNLPDLEAEDFENLKSYINSRYEDLDSTKMECEDAKTIEAEFTNSMRLILHGTNLGLFKLSKCDGEEKRRKLNVMIQDMKVIINDYKTNWLSRNRAGGLEESSSKLKDLIRQYEEALLQI